MKTLYISDLDGTLLGTDSRISARSTELLREATDAGALFTIATARTPATVVPILASTPTTATPIVMTGCAVWNRLRGVFEQPHTMPEADFERSLEVLSRYGISPFVYVMAEGGASLDVYHAAPKLNKAEESFWLERSNLPLKRFHLGTPAPVRARDHSMLFYAMGAGAGMREAATALARDCRGEICCYPDIFNPDVYNLEIFPPGVNKAAAVRRLKKAVGADRLVVFGDSLNDLTMLAEADVAVAVGNALPEVKAAADLVIEPNYTDSVARFIHSEVF